MAQRQDYRVALMVKFTVDVGSEDAFAAEAFAEYMTKHVFAEDYSRAENVLVETLQVEPLASGAAVTESETR